MVCGVSTSCFYPMETRQALQTIQQAQISTTEIFLNTFSELEPEYEAVLKKQLLEGNTVPCALHPFTSGMETFFFASLYPTRLEDGLAFYRRYFSICQRLSIPILVFHGDYTQTPFPFAKYCENFARLRDEGRRYGVEVCQENVARCKCGEPRYLRKMRTLLQNDVSFVLDVKQMRRSGAKLDDMLDAMAMNIRHLHISDATPFCDCAVPGTGEFDFSLLFRTLRKQNFSGNMVIELYRGDFSDVGALCNAALYLDKAYAGVTGEN